MSHTDCSTDTNDTSNHVTFPFFLYYLNLNSILLSFHLCTIQIFNGQWTCNYRASTQNTLAIQPDLMKVCLNSTPNKMKLVVLIRKNGLWRVYAMRWVGLGLWGRCVSYVRENCVSYARHQISYHMHAKTAYYMHGKHVRIIYMPKSILRINTTSFHFYLAYYLYAFSWDWALQSHSVVVHYNHSEHLRNHIAILWQPLRHHNITPNIIHIFFRKCRNL